MILVLLYIDAVILHNFHFIDFVKYMTKVLILLIMKILAASGLINDSSWQN